MTEHTATPWYVGAQNDILYIIDKPPRPAPVDHVAEHGAKAIARVLLGRPFGEVEANADFVCLACNAHDWLMREVAETKAMLAYIRKHAGECPADHPKLLAKMDELIARKPHEPQD